MRILVTGGCGFVGANICLYFSSKGYKIYSLDNLSRKGSLYNLKLLQKKKIKNFKFDISNYKKFKTLPKFDIIIDCCAEAAVEISKEDIDRVINTNFIGTLNILKKAKNDNSKIIFLSTSRVYPIKNIYQKLNVSSFKKKIKSKLKINEKFSTNGAKTIYGLTKLASEMLIEEFSFAFGIKYIINRCGVIAGPLQFGKQDQGFVSLWVWNHINKMKLNYIGFDGLGHQVRDVMHIDDLNELINIQIKKIDMINNKTFTVGGSNKSKISLSELTKLCEEITGNKIKINKKINTSNYDIPYYVTDNKNVSHTYGWNIKKNIYTILQDVYKWQNKNKFIINKYF